ncbi:extracellular solute-binding protein [Pseudarthrobacter sp. NPDC092439]|uniref:extracellular solute-binding protein n=1 Tax=unclassified Pseudarthrobacter TaxID=2647000 RepID=UPI00380DB24C
MRSPKSKTIALALTGLLALTSAGCSMVSPVAQESASAAAIPSELTEPVTVTFWERYCDDGVKQAVERFNEIHKGKITVDSVCVGGGESNLASKIQAAAAGGGLPDVATASEQYVTQYRKADLLVPLDPYIESSKWGIGTPEKDDFLPASLARTSLPAYGGQTLTWPFGNTANALYVNMDLLNKAGVTKAPTTWDEFAAAASAIKTKTGMAGWAAGPGDGPDLLNAVWSSGVPWVSEDGTKAQLDSPETVSVLTQWKDLFAAGHAEVSSNYKSMFTSGNAGMVFASTGYTTTWAKDLGKTEWDIAMFPHGKGQEPLTEMFGSVTEMFRSTPEKQLASWLFMKYLASAENQAAMCPVEGCLPATKSSTDSGEIAKAAQAVPQFGAAITEIAPHARLLPQSPALSEVRGKIAGDILDQVLAGTLTPEQASRQLQAKAQQAIDRNNG